MTPFFTIYGELFFTIYGESRPTETLLTCYDPGSSLRKRNDLQGKDGLTSVLCNLTNGSVRADSEDDVSGVGTSSSKG